MDSIPDEMLAVVFRYLGPGDLLGAVPLACKRWREVARSKEVWQDAVVEVAEENEDGAAWVVRRAPALGSLVFDHVFLHPCKPIVDAVLSGVSEVRHVNIAPRFHTGCHEAVYREMFFRYKDTVLSLAITDATDMLPSSPTLSKWDFFGLQNLNGKPMREPGIFDLIAAMPLLEDLNLDLTPCACLAEYNGQLGRGCPALKRFSFTVYLKKTTPYEAYEHPVLTDVVRTHGPRLTHLKLTFHEPSALKRVPPTSVGVDAQLLETVSDTCRNLVSLSLPVWCVSAMRDMCRLQSLTLDWASFFASTLQEQAVVEDFIRSSPVIANLSTLRMVGSTSEKYILIPILSAIAANSKQLRQLELHDSNCEDFEPHLESLRPALSKLKYLSIVIHHRLLRVEEMHLITNLTSLRHAKFIFFEKPLGRRWRMEQALPPSYRPFHVPPDSPPWQGVEPSPAAQRLRRKQINELIDVEDFSSQSVAIMRDLRPTLTVSVTGARVSRAVLLQLQAR